MKMQPQKLDLGYFAQLNCIVVKKKTNLDNKFIFKSYVHWIEMS